ncbi:MAG TPA: hypothetical protein VFA54_09390 [Bryobacterales bacterium]|jgi:hypothetical protein|nr:hypothetical protein [Bryobacterales bacterium]
MTGDRSDLQEAWAQALAEYSRQVEKSLELLRFSGARPTAEEWAAIERQRLVERSAFEKYRKARRAYLEFLSGAGSLALMLAFHLR